LLKQAVDSGQGSSSLFDPLAMSNRRLAEAAFTMVEIMIVISIIALLAAIALPGFLRARERSQAVRIRNDLRVIENAVDQYAIETNKKAGDPVAVVDWTNYIKKDSLLFSTGEDLLGNDYGPQTVDEQPFVPIETYLELGNVADDDFWDPYNP
jgi:prepilin-type N-terminal cleavage/methylation domain-containing protein